MTGLFMRDVESKFILKNQYSVSSESSSFQREELIACGHGELFEKNSPRLPAPPWLAFNNVKDISQKGGEFNNGYCIASAPVSSFGWAFDCHFPGDPVLPGAFLIDGLLQLTGFFGAFIGLTGKGRVAKIGESRFLREIKPQDLEIYYRIDIRRVLLGSPLIISDGVIGVDGKVAAKAHNLKVSFIF